MRFLVAMVCLVAGTSLLWSWAGEDIGGRWMLGAAITALVMFAVATGRDDD